MPVGVLSLGKVLKSLYTLFYDGSRVYSMLQGIQSQNMALKFCHGAAYSR